ncbi:MAG: 2-amino-4-hydroxy-6-hydroxymethyldihydropteridine diphosphokinase [Woeseiaceae bacterium]|nr:2-amino-4-hydroxy-6-hydroxymethyldihydropteridine diphosphokinase [Woeseiaceae bacterium]NIP21283.1 2-amino-4-hydroxy-6-hydroxymethyldihydropteridine diphosphokinase [Woeseiaceae bacterium]NIS90255.1 2-amino-4-hydroxy-6-hydroxymethyldihydropteridine diphosphokinase [Woeseiaceae bacterium]
MATVYLSLGSNIDAENNLRLGVGELRQRFGAVSLSGTYRNAAVGFDGADFLNLVAAFESQEEPLEIQRHIEEIHDKAGRQRGGAKFSSRPLDIDLLMYGDSIIDEPPLRIPRPDVLEYVFVLGPLAELAPDLVHPETGRSMRDHWQECDTGRHPMTPIDVIL